MNPKDVLRILGGLRVLRFFPNDEAAMSALVQLCGSMCSSIEQVQWLVNRVTSGIYAEWPGPQEMRACLCNRHKPKDGINAYSSVYPDGLPPDPTAPSPRLAAPTLKALPPGHVVTEDAGLDAEVQALAEKLKMPPAHPVIDQFARMLRDIETPPHERHEDRPINLNFRSITAEDIERAREELRRKRAAEQQESTK